MNVKSMIVGFLIAVVASTGTYFLVPPPKNADAAFGGLTVKELYRALDTCEVRDSGTIRCARHRFDYPYLPSKRSLTTVWANGILGGYCSDPTLKDHLKLYGRAMSREK